MHSRSRSTGFTLIELLVVIAIIAILAAILFPVFAQAREKARQASCLSNIKQINTAWHMYAQDYDERVVPIWTRTEPGNGWQYGQNWPYMLLPYTANSDIYTCPSYADSTWDGGLLYRGSNNGGYGQNHMLGYPFRDGRTMYKPLTLAEIDEPARTLVHGDTGRANAVLYSSYVPDRHSGHANVSFADGHAKAFLQREITHGDYIIWNPTGADAWYDDNAIY
ncbi:MAG: DUF1559 domain-containing protein [Armatimonadota bacterium]